MIKKFNIKVHHTIILVSLLGTLLLVLLIRLSSSKESYSLYFDGEKAFEHVAKQVGFGGRVPGSQSHQMTQEYIIEELSAYGWLTELQRGLVGNKQITNIIAYSKSVNNKSNNYKKPCVIFGAHYDSRIYADQEPEQELRQLPVPGANDGASGVAVLLELARILHPTSESTVWFAFFDAEDNGDIEGWEWIMGSSYFAEKLEGRPDAVIIVDMIGDVDLTIYKERNSNSDLVEEIWKIADSLGYSSYFLPVIHYQIIDDHLPFLRLGIPAVDIIDFDYIYWHTTHDTLDKISPHSLSIVGETLLTWLSYKQDELKEK